MHTQKIFWTVLLVCITASIAFSLERLCYANSSFVTTSADQHTAEISNYIKSIIDIMNVGLQTGVGKTKEQVDEETKKNHELYCGICKYTNGMNVWCNTRCNEFQMK